MYYLRYPDNIDLATAHTYEHAVIMDLLRFFDKRGIDGLVSADIRGETLQNIILVYDESEDEEASRLIREYFFEPRIVDVLAFETALDTVSCEDGSKYQIKDKDKLAVQLAALNKRWFKRLDDLQKPIRSIKTDEIERRNKAVIIDAEAKFDIYTVNFELNCGTSMEMLMAANLYPLLMAGLNREVMQHGYYKSCDVIDDYDDGDMGVVMAADIVAPDEVDLKQIKVLAENAIREFPNEADVTHYNKKPYKPSGTAYDYLSVGVLASYSELKKHLNYNNLRHTWSKIRLGNIVKSPDDRPKRQLPLR